MSAWKTQVSGKLLLKLLSHYTVFPCNILLKSQPGDDTMVYVKLGNYQALVGIVKRFIGRKKNSDRPEFSLPISQC